MDKLDNIFVENSVSFVGIDIKQDYLIKSHSHPSEVPLQFIVVNVVIVEVYKHSPYECLWFLCPKTLIPPMQVA